jgi:hypothetical protein
MADEEQGREPTPQADEDWKKAVAEEKERLRREQEAAPGEGGGPPPEVTFAGFVAGLYTQTLMALGELEDPRTGRRERRPGEAALLIDTLGMLKDKTEGNLTDQEADYLQRLLTDLRMRFVSPPSEPAEEPAAQDAAEAGQ